MRVHVGGNADKLHFTSNLLSTDIFFKLLNDTLNAAAACAAAVAAAVAKHGKLNGLVVATGIWSEGDTDAAEEAEYDRTMSVNVKGPFFLLSKALPHLKSCCGWATLLSSDAGIQGNR